jgi:GT2 family glycosyltransferase
MPDLSVVICSLNGAAGVDRALAALAVQTMADRLEVVLVDDGSTDGTAAVGRAHGATVVRHEVNRGLAAARNSGVAAAWAPIVAFLDDDCEPDPTWAERLLAAYDDEHVVGVGGSVVPGPGDGFTLAYLRRNNPLGPLEIELGAGEGMAYRLWLYLQRQWTRPGRPDRRPVFSLVGASMSFRREALLRVGLFDERFTFGAEELDLCYRLRRQMPGASLVLEARAVVTHHFSPALRDTLRRSRAYGRGAARMHAKWRSFPPTIFFSPVLVGGLLALSARRPRVAPLALLAPHLLFPRGVAAALRARRPAPLLDPYVQVLAEAVGNVGFAEGARAYRGIAPEEPAPAPAAAMEPAAQA